MLARISLLPVLGLAAPLRFRADGTFKAVEVSDTHFTNNLFCKDLSPAQQRYPCSDKNATEFWEKLVAEEDPDLFVFTGDNVCGGDILGGAHAIDGLLASWAPGGPNAHVPWVAVEGNHDGESGLDYAQVAAKLLTMPNGLNMPNPTFAGAPIYGNTNFLLSVLGPAGGAQENHSLLSLYLVDSNSYSTIPAVGGYGWVHLDQISYFANASAAVRAAAAAGGYPVPPALAYQHIPLPQHKTWVEGNNPIVGQYHEGVCSPDIDTGLFAQYVTSPQEIVAVTVGHDHTNDFCTATPVEGSVTLCYDGHGSYGASGYGEADWPIRARVWHVSHFGGLITTYKHLDDLAGGAAGNSTIIDQQVVFGSSVPLAGVASSQTAGNPACPAGFGVVDVDLNKDAGGTYSYLCVLRATSTGGGVPLVLNISAAVGSAGAAPVCPQGWTQQPANLKAGTSAAGAVNLCVLSGPVAAGGAVVTGLAVAQGAGAVCPPPYAQTTGDISAGVGLYEALCVQWGALDAGMVARLAGGEGALARLPRQAAWSADRPADKRPRAVQPKRRKPLEAPQQEL